MPFDPILHFTKSPSSNVEQYQVIWSLNGVDQPPVVLPQDAVMDATGYHTDFLTAQPTASLKSGDVLAARVDAMDTLNNLKSGDMLVPAFTITVDAPLPPVDGVISLV